MNESISHLHAPKGPDEPALFSHLRTFNVCLLNTERSRQNDVRWTVIEYGLIS